jgi:hypothetical protein
VCAAPRRWGGGRVPWSQGPAGEAARLADRADLTREALARGDDGLAGALPERWALAAEASEALEVGLVSLPRDSVVGEPELKLGIGVTHWFVSFPG